jgi:hypothetical protein
MRPAGINATTFAVSICPVNTYKQSLGSVSCTSCGSGLRTASAGSTSYNACCEKPRKVRLCVVRPCTTEDFATCVPNAASDNACHWPVQPQISQLVGAQLLCRTAVGSWRRHVAPVSWGAIIQALYAHTRRIPVSQSLLQWLIKHTRTSASLMPKEFVPICKQQLYAVSKPRRFDLPALLL